ncbi:MAG: DNA/RNA nuclease SfsA [Thermoanaerobacteraceae bacterium]|nr:DNA/RNA nuclease SfsA [Thermoanaerobacteraceae bacterium]
MRIENPVIDASFIKRLNRFEALVDLNGRETLVHVSNSGRLKELLLPGARVLLEIRERPGRKTPYELEMVYKGDRLISIDSQVPNRLILQSLRDKIIPSFAGYTVIEREKTFGNSRFDIKMSNESEICYMEIKGVTLEVNNIAMFPDAPTVRGSKHVKELTEVVKSGMRAVLMFVIQMDGINCFTPNDMMDPEFGSNVRKAVKSGVEVNAYTCSISRNDIALKAKVDIKL